MRVPMAHRISTSTASLRFPAMLLMLVSATFAIAAPPGHRPLPPQVASQPPGLHPFGKGRHSWWGIQMYDARLWIAGPRWSATEPHALDIEPSRVVSADTLVKHAIGEMRDLKVGDERKLKTWQAEMKKVMPNVRPGDQIVIFCSDSNRTLVYLNDSSTGEVDDPSFCPAVMSVWLHPQTNIRQCENRCSDSDRFAATAFQAGFPPCATGDALRASLGRYTFPNSDHLLLCSAKEGIAVILP